MPENKARELVQELKLVFAGKGGRILDPTLPLVLYLVMRMLAGEMVGLVCAAAAALVVIVYRMLRRESVVYALGGLSAVGLAVLFLQLGDTEGGLFLPGILSGSITVVLCVVSVLLNRPLVAWTSHLARRWPRAWYWHKQVLPAYNETTIFWGVVSALRLVLEYRLYTQGEIAALGIVRLFLGWPFTILLLIATYLYGIWRLRKLGGPGVEEFKAGVQPPWEGQRRGF